MIARAGAIVVSFDLFVIFEVETDNKREDVRPREGPCPLREEIRRGTRRVISPADSGP